MQQSCLPGVRGRGCEEESRCPSCRGASRAPPASDGGSGSLPPAAGVCSGPGRHSPAGHRPTPVLGVKRHRERGPCRASLRNSSTCQLTWKQLSLPSTMKCRMRKRCFKRRAWENKQTVTKICFKRSSIQLLLRPRSCSSSWELPSDTPSSQCEFLEPVPFSSLWLLVKKWSTSFNYV